MKKYVDGSNEQYWSEFLPEVLFYLRFNKARATGISPFQAINGFIPDIPSPISCEAIDLDLEDFQEIVETSPEDSIKFFSDFHN